jgi:hypothetical protein
MFSDIGSTFHMLLTSNAIVRWFFVVLSRKWQYDSEAMRDWVARSIICDGDELVVIGRRPEA